MVPCFCGGFFSIIISCNRSVVVAVVSEWSRSMANLSHWNMYVAKYAFPCTHSCSPVEWILRFSAFLHPLVKKKSAWMLWTGYSFFLRENISCAFKWHVTLYIEDFIACLVNYIKEKTVFYMMFNNGPCCFRLRGFIYNEIKYMLHQVLQNCVSSLPTTSKIITYQYSMILSTLEWTIISTCCLMSCGIFIFRCCRTMHWSGHILL